MRQTELENQEGGVLMDMGSRSHPQLLGNHVQNNSQEVKKNS
jgi:hypothetical protein